MTDSIHNIAQCLDKSCGGPDMCGEDAHTCHYTKLLCINVCNLHSILYWGMCSTMFETWDSSVTAYILIAERALLGVISDNLITEINDVWDISSFSPLHSLFFKNIWSLWKDITYVKSWKRPKSGREVVLTCMYIQYLKHKIVFFQE